MAGRRVELHGICDRRPHRSLSRGHWVGTSVLLALTIAAASLLVPPSIAPHDAGAAGSGVVGTSSVCNGVTGPTPSALLIPTNSPSVALKAGGRAQATIEVEEVNGSSAKAPITVVLPSLFANFPTSPSGTATLYLPAQNLTLAGTGWNHAASVRWSKVYTGGLAFRGATPSDLASEKLAVMASADYGALTIEVRWHWTLVEPGGSTVTGTWSVPTTQRNGSTSLPSLFYPAPYVSLLGQSPSPIDIGQLFNESLGGHVAGRSFFLELEFPNNGSVVQVQLSTAPARAVHFVAAIVMLDYDHYLTPGVYLVHVHDSCGAMLHSVPESAVFAPHAKVSLVTQPASCGPLTFNGHHYSSGTSATVTPSRTPFPFSVPTCAGHPFKGWSSVGGLHFPSGGELQVSSSGTFTVRYG